MRQCAAEEKICDINANSIGKKFSDLLNEITLITGLKVEETNAKPFVMLFSKFLRTYYGLLTCSEITLAFRLNSMSDLPGINGQGKDTDRIDFYGSNLTIDHIGGVLHRYMHKRALLASKLAGQRHQQKIEAPQLTKEEQEVDDKQFCNEYFRKWCGYEFTAVHMEYAHMIYDMLDRYAIFNLTNEDKSKYKVEALAIREKEIAAPAKDRNERQEKNRLIEAYLNDDIPEAEQLLVKHYAKRLVLLEQFKNWKEQNRIKIFEL